MHPALRLAIAATVALLTVFIAPAQAQLTPQHKIVLQVSSANPQVQSMALHNAVNLQKQYGMDNIAIEIVAFGPGLSLLTRQSDQAQRVESLVLQNIRFSACHNTMAAIARRTGHMPVLLKGVKVVPAGVGRIMELEEQGYAYVRP